MNALDSMDGGVTPGRRGFLTWLMLLAVMAMIDPMPGMAQVPDEDSEDRTRVFTLGEIIVIGAREGGLTAGASLITQEQMRTFERTTLDQAANLAPGVVGLLEGNSRRNESNIFVRGQDRWRVPLMIDGVRFYLPADNRIDFSRFLTTNLAAIQIQKGYASVLDGPGAMGGAINIVTSRPVRPFESEVGLTLGGRSDVEEWSGYVTAGARREAFYVQGSYSHADRDSWTLSNQYEPTENSLQDRGERLGSDTRDWSLNLKAGYTPNDTDEYAINFIRQEGEKSGLLDVYNGPPPMPNSFWKWPWWNVQTLSLLSSTGLGETSRLKAKVYYNTFDNALYMYDDVDYAEMTRPFTRHSLYDDHSYGATVELGTNPSRAHTLNTAFHYRSDVHNESQHIQPDVPGTAGEPWHRQALATWSLAAENTFHAAPDVDIVAGVSYESYDVTASEEFDPSEGTFERDRGGANSFNWQSAAIWRQAPTRQLHASVSSRTRFPGLWELYSTRFGAATPNPDLGPERATNFEVGWSEQTAGDARLSVAVFYNALTDLIQSVPLEDDTVQPQNVGDGRAFGFELSADVRLAPRLRIGGQYSYIDREIVDEVLEREREEAGLPELRLTGVPPHSAFLYATWQPAARLTVTPSVEISSDLWSDVTAVNTAADWDAQVETGAHTLLNLVAEYGMSERVHVAVGARNLLDEHYELSWGLPQPGRNLYVKMRMGM